MTGNCREGDLARVNDNGEEHPAAGDVAIGPLLNLQPAPQIDLSFRGSLEAVRLKSAIADLRRGWRLIDGVMIKLSQSQDTMERRVGPRKQAALGLAEMKDRTSRVESDVTGLRAAMADGSTKVEEVRRAVARLKAHVSDCPKVNQELANLEGELATLKEEMRELRVPKATMADQRLRQEQEIRDMKHDVELLRKASDG
jgi:chromosome segregation ATPase